jgi:hypothetical protein
MAVRCTPPISFSEVFEEIYGRPPGLTEAHSLESLVLASNLSNKAAPYDLLRFLCYTHGFPSLSGNWVYALTGAYGDGGVEPGMSISVPRRVARRVSSSNTFISADPNNNQQNHASAGTGITRRRWDATLVIAKHRLFYCDHNGFIFISDNKGQSWSYLNRASTSSGSINVLSPHNINPNSTATFGRIYMINTVGEVVVFENGSTATIHSNTSVPESGFDDTNNRPHPAPALSMRPDGSRIFAAGRFSDGSSYIDYAAGLPVTTPSWIRSLNLSVSDGGMPTGIVFSKTNANYAVYFGMKESLGYTRDGGNTWVKTAPPVNSTFNWLHGEADGNKIVVCGHDKASGSSKFAVYDVSPTIFATYQNNVISGMSYARKIRIIGGTYYIIAGLNNYDLTLWASTDTGTTWSKISTEVPSNIDFVIDLVRISDIPDAQLDLALADYWSDGYFSSADACQYGGSTNPVYTQTGNIVIGEYVYWDNNGTQLLSPGYYNSSGAWYQVDSSSIVVASGACGMGGGGF